MSAHLISIQEVIAGRAASTLSAHPEWPCRAGCDSCCRRLAAIPEISQAEWDLLIEGFQVLSTAELHQVIERTLALEHRSRPYICPMLDRSTGRCLTYTQRPIACRTYGFYVEQGEGLYCDQIDAGVEKGDFVDVVWGNQAGSAASSIALGPQQSLVDWYRSHRDKSMPSFFNSSP